MDVDVVGSKDLFAMYLSEGVEVLENKELFESDKEYYFKDFIKVLESLCPDAFCWYDDKTESVVIEIDNKNFSRVSYEDDKLIYFKDEGFSYDKAYVSMIILTAMLLFAGHIEEKKSSNEKDISVKDDVSNDDDDDLEWV
jgi:hypothetical protein